MKTKLLVLILLGLSSSLMAQVKTCKCDNATYTYQGKLGSQYKSSSSTSYEAQYYYTLQKDTVYFYSLAYLKGELNTFSWEKMAVKDFLDGEMNEFSIHIKKNTDNSFILQLGPAAFGKTIKGIKFEHVSCDTNLDGFLPKTTKVKWIMGKFDKEEDAKAFLAEIVKAMDRLKKK